MAKVVCDFTFDKHTYCVIAHSDAFGRVTQIERVPEKDALAPKGPRAKDVADLADVFGSLLQSAGRFAELQSMPLSPLGCAIIGAIERRALFPRKVSA